MTLRNLDLNLLKTLDALLTEQNVTRAGRRLGLTQSATSSALKRLRVMFDDDLLVMVGRVMQPTPRAELLRPQITKLLDQIVDVVQPAAFNPKTSTRHFVIASADYATLILMPSFLRLLETEAPHMRLHIVELGSQTLPHINDGKLDCIIAPRTALGKAGLQTRSLFKEQLVCVASKTHPDIRGKIDKATFRRMLHARYQPDQDIIVSNEAHQLDKKKVHSEPSITCPSFVSLPFLVGASNSIALIQERLAVHLKDAAGLQIVRSPIRTDAIDITLFWTARQNSDIAHTWMRNAISRVSKLI